MSKTIYLDDECDAVIEDARVTDKGLIPKIQALRNLLGVKRVSKQKSFV